MGYETYWSGEAVIEPEIEDLEHIEALEGFISNSTSWGGSGEPFYIPDDDLTRIVVPEDTGKFYEAQENIQALVQKLHDLGYLVGGEFFWDGEESDDFGKIEIVNNVITIKQVVFTYGGPGHESTWEPKLTV